MSTPRVSFLIPVLDEEARLEACLRSVLAQTMPDFEVVVVDDGSSDDSVEIATRLARSDARIRVHTCAVGEGEGASLPRALNRGLELCRADFVARLDADDRAAPERLAWQLARFAQDPGLTLVDGRVAFVGVDQSAPGEGMVRYGHWVNQILEPGDFDRAILHESPVVHPAATFRHRAIVEAGGYREGEFPEDYDLWVRLHLRGARFAKVEHVCVEMLDHQDRLTRTHASYRREAFRMVAQHWIEERLLVPGARLALWGGPNRARPWLRWLRSRGHPPVVFVDIDRRRIGRTKGGDIPVIGPEGLATRDVDVLLVAMQDLDAVARIRHALRGIRPDWQEGRDWWPVVS